MTEKDPKTPKKAVGGENTAEKPAFGLGPVQLSIKALIYPLSGEE